MASNGKVERRSRRGSGRQQRGAAQNTSAESSGLLSLSAAVEQPTAADISKGDAGTNEVSILHLLGSVPSPARKQSNRQLGIQGIPCSPPPHSPNVFATTTAPPPPPVMPMLECEAAPSYRDRLRAGGQGAFQRAFDRGLVPRSMKNEWSMAQPTDMQNVYSQQPDGQSGNYMQCMAGSDSQQNWSGSGHNYWYVPMEQSQMSAPCSFTQQAPIEQHHMSTPCSYAPQMPLEQQHMYNQQAPLEQAQMSAQCTYPQQQQTLVQLPPAAMAQPPQIPQMPTPTMSDATPTDLMSIIMPQSAQFPCDRDLMAAQLKAAASCQCYED